MSLQPRAVAEPPNGLSDQSARLAHTEERQAGRTRHFQRDGGCKRSSPASRQPDCPRGIEPVVGSDLTCSVNPIATPPPEEPARDPDTHLRARSPIARDHGDRQRGATGRLAAPACRCRMAPTSPPAPTALRLLTISPAIWQPCGTCPAAGHAEAAPAQSPTGFARPCAGCRGAIAQATGLSGEDGDGDDSSARWSPVRSSATARIT
jgi:hypothetical protein